MKNILALLAAGLLLSACETGPKIRANTAPSANLQSYKTYAFPTKLGTDRGDVQTPLTGYFKEAVRREMDARGYQFVEGGDADLWVNFHVNAKDQTDVRSSPSTSYGVGYYGYRGGMYGGYGGGTDVTTVHYKVGTANIDVRSFNLNFELTVLMYGDEAAGRLAAIHRKYMADSCLIDREKWNARPVLWRYAESAVSLLSPLL